MSFFFLCDFAIMNCLFLCELLLNSFWQNHLMLILVFYPLELARRLMLIDYHPLRISQELEWGHCPDWIFPFLLPMTFNVKSFSSFSYLSDLSLSEHWFYSSNSHSLLYLWSGINECLALHSLCKVLQQATDILRQLWVGFCSEHYIWKLSHGKFN